MGRISLSTWMGAVAGVWILCGCSGGSALEAQRERMAGEHLARMAELDRIESRLLMAQARQREWNELQRRHEQVSAIACENVSEHVAAMIRHEERQLEKSRRKRAAARRETVIEARSVPGETLTAIEGGVDGG